MERESIAWSISERNGGDARSKEVAVAESRRAETENLICAAQEQVLRTKAIKNGNYHKDVSPLCKLCKEEVESVTHIVSLSSVLAGNQYIKRHDKLGKKLLWLLCKKLEIECEDEWFSHQLESVLENDKCKILWDFLIQTDKEIQHRRPDILVIEEEKRECKIVDIPVPGDQNIKVKELEKVTKYQELRLQVQKLWGVKVTFILIVADALGTVCEEVENNLKTIGIPIVISYLQKAVLLGTAFILRRVLGISDSG